MDLWIFVLLSTCVGFGTIFYLYSEKIRELARWYSRQYFTWFSSMIGVRHGRSSTTTGKFGANSPYAAAGKIGLAIVIANQYEGAEKLNGTAKDKEQWENVFEYLQFDVRTSGEIGLNASKEEMLRLCNLPQIITIKQKDVRDYRYIAFVFSGHGYKDANHNDVIVSQDWEPLSLESEVFPCLFGGRRGDCIKLIFIDACRSDPTQEKLILTESHVEKAISCINRAVHVAPDLPTVTDDAFIAFATLKGLSAEDTAQGSIFSSSFTKWLRQDISLVSAMMKVTEEVNDSRTQQYYRPMSVSMLSRDVNLYKEANLNKGRIFRLLELITGWIPWFNTDTGTQAPVDPPPQPPLPQPQPSPPQPGETLVPHSESESDDGFTTAPSPSGEGVLGTESNVSFGMSSSQSGDPPLFGSQQNGSMDSVTDDEEIIQTPQPESDGGVMLPSQTDEEIIQTPLPESGDVVVPPSQTGDPPVDGSQQNRSTDPQLADRTERDEDLDGPTAPNQLSDTDHGMDSHVLNSPIQASQESPRQSPEPRGHPIIVLSPLQVPHKSQDPPVLDNPVNVQHEENVTDSPPVAGEQPQQIQAGVQNKYQVVPEGEVAEQHRNMGESPQVPSDDKNMEGISPVLSFNRAESAPVPDHHSNHPYVPQLTTLGSQGIHSKPQKDPNRLTIRALMPYIGDLASLGLQISGWLDKSKEWTVISKTPGSPRGHLQQLLMEWLNGDEDPDVPHTWEHFIGVVRFCKREILAEKMEREVFGRPRPSPSGPAEVHDPSTTVRGHDHPVLDSTPSESEIEQKVGSKISADWEHFAIQLSFDGNTRRKIRKNNLGNCDDCFANVVSLWLERSAGSKDTPRTWRAVLEAVRKCGHWGVADDVRKSLLADHNLED